MRNINASTPMELVQAIVDAQAGDVIRLAPGDYGALVIHGGSQYNKVFVGTAKSWGNVPSLAGKVRIVSADLNDPATVQSIDVRSTENWAFDRLNVRPGWQPETTRAVLLDGDDLIIANCDITHGDPTGWSSQDWLARAGHGIEVRGRYCFVIGNRIETVATGIQFIGDAGGGVARYNYISGICRDAMRIRSDDVTLEDNVADKWRIGNPNNHYDCVQCWSEAQRHGGTVKNAVIRGNHFYAPPEPGEPLYKSPMGITVTHTIAENFLIENNVIATYDRANAIRMPFAIGCAIRNNTLVNVNPDPAAQPIFIWTDGDDQTVIVANICGRMNLSGSEQLSGNLVAKGFDDYDGLFADWQAGDFTLIDPAGAGATINSAPLPPAPPIYTKPIPATVEEWQVMEIDGAIEAVRIIKGEAAPLTEAEALALADQINAAWQ